MRRLRTRLCDGQLDFAGLKLTNSEVEHPNGRPTILSNAMLRYDMRHENRALARHSRRNGRGRHQAAAVLGCSRFDGCGAMLSALHNGRRVHQVICRLSGASSR